MSSDSTMGTGASIKKPSRKKLPAPNAIVGGTLALVVIVQGDELGPVGDPEGLQQALRRAGVFGGDDGGGFERRDEARRRVAEVPDGRRGEDDHRPSIGWCP